MPRGIKWTIKGERGIRALYSRYRGRCRYKNVYFDLSLDEFRIITARPCHYCGYPPCMKSLDYTYSSLDRVNAQRGYDPTNVVPCCKVCNRAKGDLPLELFQDWVRRIHRGQEGG